MLPCEFFVSQLLILHKNIKILFFIPFLFLNFEILIFFCNPILNSLLKWLNPFFPHVLCDRCTYVIFTKVPYMYTNHFLIVATIFHSYFYWSATLTCGSVDFIIFYNTSFAILKEHLVRDFPSHTPHKIHFFFSLFFFQVYRIAVNINLSIFVYLFIFRLWF